MNMIEYLDKLRDAGISSIKIEGRMKTEYYVANIVNAYRMALDYLYSHKKYNLPKEISNEVYKSSHRDYSTGFYFGDPKQTLDTSLPVSDYEFVALVVEDSVDGYALVEMRNRFKVGEDLELLSKSNNNAIIKVEEIINEEGESIQECKVPKQLVRVKTNIALHKYEIIRRNKC